MKSLPRNLLPDGTPFRAWDCATTFSHTYHVAQDHPQASDDNAGTESEPWRTIDRAARVLQPGERVLVHAGTYRETVRPERGGNGPDSIISYEAAPGEDVTVSGAEILKGPWQHSDQWAQPTPGANVWFAELPRPSHFDGSNPFAMVNLTSLPWMDESNLRALPKYASETPFVLRRGLLFADGQPLRQVLIPAGVFNRPGTYWVEDDGLRVHLRLPDDGSPSDHEVLFTAREQLFSPSHPHLGYLRVKGFRFEYAGNGFPGYQRGAVSTRRGHHWIIEDNEIRWANSIGLDIGDQSSRHSRAANPAAGAHIIRRNLITDCGICAICGVPKISLDDVLIERNRLLRNCWQDVEQNCESSAIKLHKTHRCLLRENVILDTRHGTGVWLDWTIVNSRVTGNIVLNTGPTAAGAIMVEAAHKPNLVDANIIVGVRKAEGGILGGGHGVYEHDCDRLEVRQNLIAEAQGAGICLNRGDVNRMVNGRGAVGRSHQVHNNLITACGKAIILPTPDNSSDGNLFGTFSEISHFHVQIPEHNLNFDGWREFFGWDEEGQYLSVQVQIDASRATLTLSAGEPAIQSVIALTNGSIADALEKCLETLSSHKLTSSP